MEASDLTAAQMSLAPHLADPTALIPTRNLKPQKLDEAIGPSEGRIGMLRHLKRVKFCMDNIPESVWPSFAAIQDKFYGGTGIVAGGGPSLEHTWPEIARVRAELGNKARIFAPNKSHDFLLSKGITPDFGVLMDPSEHVASYITPHPNVIYLLGTTLHWSVYKRFLDAGSKVFLFTPIHDPELSDITIIPAMYPDRNHAFIPGGSAVGLRTLEICISMGMNIEAHGFDSCYAPLTKKLYAYDKPHITTDLADAIAVSKRNKHEFRFRANHHMAKQMIAFQGFIDMWPHKTINGQAYTGTMTMHGDGVIPWMVWNDGCERMEHAMPERMAEKYGGHRFYDYASDGPTEKSWGIAA